jgi:hypothetical protein
MEIAVREEGELFGASPIRLARQTDKELELQEERGEFEKNTK